MDNADIRWLSNPYVELLMAKTANRPIRPIIEEMNEEQARKFLDDLGDTVAMLPIVLAKMGLPQGRKRTNFWLSEVMPLLRAKLRPPSRFQREGRKVIYDTPIVQIKEENDIVDFARKHTDLVATGETYKGPCPIHQDTDPSFVVYPKTQSYYCFGCKSGGDVINLAKVLGVEFN